MKVNRLAKAELGKIFLRPAIYFMTAFLVLALIITFFSYSPTVRNNDIANFGTATQNVSDIFSAFNNESSTNSNSKVKLDDVLETAYTDIQDFSNATSVYDELLAEISPLNTSLSTNYDGSFLYHLLNLAENMTNSTARANFITALTEVRQDADNIYQNLNNFDSDLIDFYATTTQIDSIIDLFSDIVSVIPREESLNLLTNTQLKDLGERIRDQYSLTSTLLLVESFDKIEINTEKLDAIYENYYTNIKYITDNTTNTLNVIFNEIEDYATENSSSESVENLTQINLLITEYKNAVNIATALLQNSFALEKAGGLSDSQLNTYVGFEDFNSYNIKEIIVLNNYLLENQIFDGEYLLNYNFGTTIGYTESAYDFAFYAMQILSVIITIFCLFFAVTILAGEHINGTMKMLAIRPFTRDKIINGKILSCIYFMIMFIIISAVASFVVGYSMFGLVGGNILLVFNATTVFALPPYIVFLLYLVSLGLNIVLYICIASMLSVLFRSNTFALFVTFILYFFGILFNAISVGAGWYSFTPYAHLDLFKYLGNSNVTGTLFGMNVIPDGNFYFSLGYILTSIIIFKLLTKDIFRKRDIA